jgi:hypothetical protein
MPRRLQRRLPGRGRGMLVRWCIEVWLWVAPPHTPLVLIIAPCNNCHRSPPPHQFKLGGSAKKRGFAPLKDPLRRIPCIKVDNSQHTRPPHQGALAAGASRPLRAHAALPHAPIHSHIQQQCLAEAATSHAAMGGCRRRRMPPPPHAAALNRAVAVVCRGCRGRAAGWR